MTVQCDIAEPLKALEKRLAVNVDKTSAKIYRHVALLTHHVSLPATRQFHRRQPASPTRDLIEFLAKEGDLANRPLTVGVSVELQQRESRAAPATFQSISDGLAKPLEVSVGADLDTLELLVPIENT